MEFIDDIIKIEIIASAGKKTEKFFRQFKESAAFICFHAAGFEVASVINVRMEKEVEERFERIERNLERVSVRMDQIGERMDQLSIAQIETQGWQANMQKVLDRIDAKVEANTEAIGNLAILVNQLVERDLGRS